MTKHSPRAADYKRGIVWNLRRAQEAPKLVDPFAPRIPGDKLKPFTPPTPIGYMFNPAPGHWFACNELRRFF